MQKSVIFQQDTKILGISLNIPFYIHEVKDVAVGDSIYLFNKQHEIPFSKCNVIGVDIDASSVKDSLILDGIAGNSEIIVGKVMAVRLSEKYDNKKIFSLDELKNHNFDGTKITKVTDNLKDFINLGQGLIESFPKNKKFNVERYDGSYELVRATVKAYSHLFKNTGKRSLLIKIT